MLTENEKIYITEHYVGWKAGWFRYWDSLPQAQRSDILNLHLMQFVKQLVASKQSAPVNPS